MKQFYPPQLQLFISAILLLFGVVSNGQTSTFTSSGTWVCPQGVTSIQVEVYGSGGGGGYGGGSNKQGGGGGGGGGYTKNTSVTVVPGTSYAITIGTGGTGGSGAVPNGINGLITTAVFGATTVSANGGNGGKSYSNGGVGGTGGVGANNTGGTGGTGISGGSGGGGGCAGMTGAGNGAVPTAGTAGGGGIAGAGGAGNTSNSGNGVNGVSYGGGGGGGTRNSNGGVGANGYVLLTYTCPNYTVSAGADQTLAGCATTTTLSGSAAPSGTTGTWSVVSGTATITSPNSPTSTVTGLTLGTSAQLQWTISNGICGSTSSATPVTITTSYGPGCLILCTPTGNLNCSSFSDYISNVTINTLNNTTTCGAGGYTNFAATGSQTTSLQKGSTYTLSVGAGAGAGTHGAAVWIDFNQNGVFTDSGEYFLISNAIAPNTTSTVSIPLPLTAGTGSVRMRIRYAYAMTVASTMSCTMSGTYGETEDYTLTLTDPPACTTPSAQPTALALTLGSTDITGAFTAASPAPNNYLVVINTTGVTPVPVNGTTYSVGSTFSGNTVVDTDNTTGFIASGLSITTHYYLYVFSYNSACTGGPLYNNTTPAAANGITLAVSYCTPTGNLTCSSNDYIANVTINTLNNSSTCSATGYTSYAATGTQTTILTRGNSYNFSMSSGSGNKKHGAGVWIDFNQNNTFEATEYFALGNLIIASSTTTITIAVPAGATLGTTRMRVRYGKQTNVSSASACTMSGTYGETEDYTITIADPVTCVAPTSQPTSLILSPTGTTIAGSFTAPSPAPSNYLVVINTTGTVPAPVNGTTYAIGGTVGAGNTVVDNDSNATFTATGLSVSTTYYVFVFGYNAACSGGPAYNVTSPLNASAATITSNYCSATVSSGQQSLGYFSEVSFVGTLNDVSNYSTYSSSPLGYQDFTTLTNLARQAQGEGVNISVQALNSSFMKAWVDWNKDGDFTDAGEQVYSTGGISTYSTTFGFIIPASQAVGNYRIRLRLNSRDFSFPYDSNSTDSYTSCGNINYPGETEDYLFTVIASCSAQIATVIDGRTCGTGTVTLGATSSAAGVTQYRWYSTPTGSTLVGTSATGTWTTPSISTTTTYYVTCYNGCESLTRTAVTATVSPIPTLTYSPTTPFVCGEDVVLNLTATGDAEEVYLIDEKFTSGLGTFSNTNILSTVENATSQWQTKTSTFIPTAVTNYNVWFPAISSGVNGNNFAMATSDVGGVTIHNQMASATVNSTNFQNLALSFKLFYSRYYEDGQYLTLDYVTVDVSTNGGTSWTEIQRYTEDVGIGTRFETVSFDLSSYINQSNLKIRVRYYGEWCDGLAVDDVKLYGYRPISTALSWTSASPVNAFTDAGCTVPYTAGTPALNVYVKPTLAQLEQGTYTFTANATLANGCTTSQNIVVTNNSKIWQGITTDWNDANNWKPAGVPTSANCVIIPSTSIISGSGYNAYAKNLTVKSGGALTVNSANNITVTDAVTVASGGLFDIKNNSSLVQITDSAINSGSIKMTRTSRSMTRWAYVYYGSPVAENVFGQIPSQFDYKFKWTSGTMNGTWSALSSTTLANGFIARVRDIAPFSAGTGTIDFTFTGTPNNGVIPLTVDSYDSSSIVAGNTMLIANPYPCAIDATAFLTDPNNTELGGTLFFWTSITTYTGAGLYNTQDYGSWNLSGGVGTAPATDPTNASLKPTGKIAAGQGFFAQVFADGPINFKNSMRVSGSNTQFFRTSETESVSRETHRIWLNLYNDHSFRQTLVGYIEGATNGIDRLYDGDSFTSNEINIYSVAAGRNLVIQGKALPFDPADVIQMGYKVTSNGTYTIAIDETDGVFAGGQRVYLRDKLTNSVNDLANPYSFASPAGTFNDRFEIVFSTPELSTDSFNSNTADAFIKNEMLYIQSPGGIRSVMIYDVAGKLIRAIVPSEISTSLQQPFSEANGVYIAKITMDNGSTASRKLIR